MLAFVFPGQGSQYPGMGKALAADFPQARQVFEEADDALQMHLSRLCFEGPEDDLKLTANTQPAILTVSIAALRVLEAELGWQPDYAAGHSLGEYAAWINAGALDFSAAVKTVRQRGTYMQEAVPVGQGAMAAVMGLAAETVESLCQQQAGQQVVSPANYNAPGQLVIAGDAEAVERVLAAAKEQGAKRAVKLPVSAPFHCSLMEPAGQRLAAYLANVEVAPPQLPVVSNVDACPHEQASKVCPLLVRQVSSPVRWSDSVSWFRDQGVQQYVEIGPGKVLSGLIKRIHRQATIHQVADPEGLKALG